MEGKLIKLERSPFGFNNFHIDYEIDGKLFVGVLIEKEKIDKITEDRTNDMIGNFQEDLPNGDN